VARTEIWDYIYIYARITHNGNPIPVPVYPRMHTQA